MELVRDAAADQGLIFVAPVKSPRSHRFIDTLAEHATSSRAAAGSMAQFLEDLAIWLRQVSAAEWQTIDRLTGEELAAITISANVIEQWHLVWRIFRTLDLTPDETYEAAVYADMTAVKLRLTWAAEPARFGGPEPAVFSRKPKTPRLTAPHRRQSRAAQPPAA